MQGVILNVNDIIVDVDQLQFQAWRNLVMYEYGMGLPGKLAKAFKGQDRDQVLAAVLEYFHQSAAEKERQDLLKEQDHFYDQVLDQVDGSKLLPGAEKLIISFYDHYVKVGVHDQDGHAAELIKQLGLDEYVDLVGPQSKTTGNPYTALLQKLDVPAKGSLGIVIRAADLKQTQAAGLTTIGVGDANQLANADYQVSQVGDLRYQMLEKVWEDQQ